MMKTNLLLVAEHGFSFSEIDMFVPFERSIYVALLIKHLEEKKKRLENR